MQAIAGPGSTAMEPKTLLAVFVVDGVSEISGAVDVVEVYVMVAAPRCMR